MLRRIIMLMAPKTFAFNLGGTSSNLRTSALSAGWNGSMHVTATVPSGITPLGLIVDGSFPSGVKLVVASGGFIKGAGGSGGAGGGTNYGAGGNGLPGGTALAVSVAVTVDNLGAIQGGGGGGGGGGGALAATGGSGGGGASYSFTAQAGGLGSTGFSGAGPAGVSGGGGNGGDFGSVGGDGYTGNAGGSPGGTGGAAGAAVTGNSNITWINTGTRTGAIS